ncbi:MAG: S46 family peptidase [Rikenellaceae bacterium]
MRRGLPLLLLLLFVVPLQSRADEGMWLVNLLNGQLYKQMQAAGLHLDASQIYNEDELSIKDAIVMIDNGQCSGSIISENGLMITNHHCAYSDIHANSTLENNYLESGFWAQSYTEEIPIKGKTVALLKKVEDVTERVEMIADSLDKIAPRGPRFLGKVEIALKKMIDTPYEIWLHSMWKGQKYYLYYYEIYQDVRLVGAPPVSIGAYGGEQDNWGWPQHKGDFTLYRIYTAADGSPAEYSEQNVPLKAQKYLKVSSEGYKEGDYTMILGYPGRTNRYIPSAELIEKFEILNPIISTVRRAKLDVWKEYMDASPEVRLKYADKYFSVSNYCDFAKWENLCIERYDIVAERKKQEAELTEWIEQDASRKEQYGTLLSDLDNLYKVRADLVAAKEYIRETLVMGADITLLAQRLKSLRTHFKSVHCIDCKKHQAIQSFCQANLKTTFDDGDKATDRELFTVMVEHLVENVDSKYLGEDLAVLLARFDYDAERFVEYIYDTSVIADRTRFEKFLNGEITKSDIENDPMFIVADGINIIELNAMEAELSEEVGYSETDLKNRYTEAFYKMQIEKGQSIYPDANSTMRFTYGTVGSLSPRDGVYYHWQTTSKGILEKYDPEDYEFNLLDDYKSLLEVGDWGKWGENGDMCVDFLTNNDITGGNSGSAVLNADGELIGLAFDGNRESMGASVYFHDEYAKCVCVDIRYILWVVEHYGAAESIIKELE